MGSNHWHTANTRSQYAVCLTELGRYDEAEEMLLAAYPVLRDVMGEQNTRTQLAVRRLTELYEAWDKPEKAAEHRVQLDEVAPR